MRILFVGDVVGRSGRAAVTERLPGLRQRLALDAVIVNAENAAGGFGLTAKIADELFAAGADVITLGNHSWDQREMVAHVEREPRILRPANMRPGTPGRGAALFDLGQGRKLAVVQVLCRLFMNPVGDPFRAVEDALRPWILGGNVDAVVIDVHGEATSEKQAIGHCFDGRASLVVGTHTHIPTADARVLTNGTAYMTDAGMSGDYDSVIGMNKSISLQRFRSDTPGPRNEPAGGEATLCGVVVETDSRTGLARSVSPLRVGGGLAPTPAEG